MAYRLRRLLGEGGRSYEKFEESTRGDGLGTSMATWHTHTNSRYPVSRARLHIKTVGVMEYWSIVRIQPNNAAFHHSVTPRCIRP